ncbi:hypothetical protein Bca4012_061505 [Brassica carinata]
MKWKKKHDMEVTRSNETIYTFLRDFAFFFLSSFFQKVWRVDGRGSANGRLKVNKAT